MLCMPLPQAENNDRKMPMTTLQGKSVCCGIVKAKLAFYHKKERHIRRFAVQDKENQWQRYLEAKKEAAGQLERLKGDTGKLLGQEEAAVFEMQKLMLDDCEYEESLRSLILEQGLNAEYAVYATGESMARRLGAVEDAYIKERAQDVRDISERLLNVLDQSGAEEEFPKEPSIVAADDLTPSETVRLAGEKVMGFVLREGGIHSHTAIFARNMGVPALVGVGDSLLEVYDNTEALLDGDAGALYIDPDEELLSAMEKKKQQADAAKKRLLMLKGLDNITSCGRRIEVFANVGSLEDIDSAIRNDTGGIGLLRSEILYLGRDSEPDEETQFAFYRSALEKMEGREVTIRTMDIGADKKLSYLKLPSEENPALGFRAIRICLERPELFKVQLRALYRAGRYGKLRILYPMITSQEELCRIREIELQAKEELLREGLPFEGNVPSGIMIETPAAALISGRLAEMTDFFSVGTNDLTQYTLALDRQNAGLERFFDAHHPAVLELIRMAALNAHKAGIKIGICGELAADLSLTDTFIEMGIDELSVSPGMILSLREKIRGI